MSCSDCSQCPTDRPADSAEAESPALSGRRLCVAAVGAFLLPIAMAIVAVVIVTLWYAADAWSKQGHAMQLVGAIVGLSLGVACSKVVTRQRPRTGGG